MCLPVFGRLVGLHELLHDLEVIAQAEQCLSEFLKKLLGVVRRPALPLQLFNQLLLPNNAHFTLSKIPLRQLKMVGMAALHLGAARSDSVSSQRL